MLNNKPALHLICLKVAFLLIYAALSINVMIAFVSGGSRYGENGWQSIYKGLHQTWDLPYTYRVLMPSLEKMVLATTPQALQDGITAQLKSWRDTREIRKLLFHGNPQLPMSFTDAQLFETCLMFLLVYISLWGVIIMSYYLAAELMPDSPAYALIAPVTMLLAIVPAAKNFGFVYDFTEIFFCCTLLYLMHRQNWSAYLICFELGTFNKESTLLIIPVYFLWCWQRLPLARYLLIGAGQTAIFFATRFFLHWLYYYKTRGQDGYFHDSAIDKWLVIIFFNYPTLIGFVITIAFMLYRWPEKPSFLKAALWMLPPNIIFYAFRCNINEYRDFFWNFPVLTLLVTHTFVHWTGMPGWPIFRRALPQRADVCAS